MKTHSLSIRHIASTTTVLLFAGVVTQACSSNHSASETETISTTAAAEVVQVAPAPAQVCGGYRVQAYTTNANLQTCQDQANGQGDAACRALGCYQSRRNDYQIGGLGPYYCYGQLVQQANEPACPAGSLAGNNCYVTCLNCANANDCSTIAGTICCPNGTCKPNGQC
jgi:hypothetical protein